MIPTIFTTLALGAHVLSTAGQAFIAAILIASTWVPGSQILTGHTFIVPDENTTTAPGIYLNDETTPISTYPVLPGTEYCTGNTGALLCTVTIKLTGSGGNPAHTAGSYLCSTSTCSIIDARAFTEAVPKASEFLFGGWTTTPGTASGFQLFNRYAASSGATIIGSGAYVTGGANPTNIEKDVPPGSTIKFTWSLGNGSETYDSYKAAVVLRFWKYYTP